MQRRNREPTAAADVNSNLLVGPGFVGRHSRCASMSGPSEGLSVMSSQGRSESRTRLRNRPISQ